MILSIRDSGSVRLSYGYAIQGSALAIRAGGRGDVSETHRLWETPGGATVPSPVYYDGHLYWVRGGGTASCLNVSTGKIVFRERLSPNAGRIYASVIAADGKLYCVSQQNGTYVLAARRGRESFSSSAASIWPRRRSTVVTSRRANARSRGDSLAKAAVCASAVSSGMPRSSTAPKRSKAIARASGERPLLGLARFIGPV